MRKSVLTPFDMDRNMGGEPIFYQPHVSPDIIHQVNWVPDCMRVITQAVKGVHLGVYRIDGDDEIKRNRLARLMKRPNPWMTGRQLRAYTQLWKEILGNAYWWLVGSNKDAPPEAIFLLDPRYVAVIPDSQGEPVAYQYAPAGKPHRIPAEQVIHFMEMPDPFNPLYGTSAFQQMGKTLESEIARQRYDLNFFKKGGRLSLGFKVARSLTDKVFRRLKGEIQETYAGEDNHHKVGVFEEAEPVVTGVSQKDMDFVSLARFNRDRILAAFGVPPSKLGLVEDANRSNSDEQDHTFWENIKAKLDDMQETITWELAQRFGNYEVRFDDVVQDDEEKLFSVALKMKAVGAYTGNEIRQYTGYHPRPEMERVIGHNPGPDGDGGGPGGGQSDDQGQEEEEGQKSEEWESGVKTKDRPSQTLMDRFVQNKEEFGQRMIRKYGPKIRRVFEEQEKRVLRVIQENGKSQGNYNFGVKELWNDDREDQALMAALVLLWLDGGRYAYSLVSDLFFEEKTPFSADSKSGREMMRLLRGQMGRINETTRDRIQETVAKGMAQGWPVDQIAEEVRAIFEVAKRSRANIIAKSEAAEAFNLAVLFAYRDHGIKRVLVYDGTDHDEDCRRANGSIWSIKKAIANPKEHPHCVRTFFPLFPSGKSLDDLVREEGVDWEEHKLETLDQWRSKIMG